MNRRFIKKNKLVITILLLVICVLIINSIKPAFLYRKNGSIRNFGLGIKSKTIIPLWLVIIILSILLYIMVDFYIKYT